MTRTSDIVAPSPVSSISESEPLVDVPKRPFLDLFLISFLILFFELACIRWFGSAVVFLTFFTNIVLLACFLGMSVGLMTAGRKTNYIRWALPLTFFTASLAMISFNLYVNHYETIAVSVGGQTKSPQLIYFGTEYVPKDATKIRYIPLWSIAGVFFALVSLMFIGLGQAMGRAFDAIPNRVLAYTVDVLGSLTGIAIFAGMSYLRYSPHIWFAPIVLILLYLIRKRTYFQIFAAIGIVFVIALNAYGAGQGGIETYWSPYYKIAYTPSRGDINTNNIAHQQMVKVGENGSAYSLVHLLNRDSHGTPFEDVMIIGAGSGNDVSAALRYGAKHIDAVEIDPTINWIGRSFHPDKPYDDERLHPGNKYVVAPTVNDWGIHLDDGRSFTRKSPHQYDLAIYALVDSLVLHSGYSSLRLENFLFTQEAFHDIKQKLKPGGVFAMYNYYRQGWVVSRLKAMAWKEFGVEPIVISLPFQEKIDPTDNLSEAGKAHITFLIVGKDSAKLEAIRKSFEEKKNFWVNFKPSENEALPVGAGFADDVSKMPAASSEWRQISRATVTTQPTAPAGASEEQARSYKAIESLPSDDWPQLYLQTPTIPVAPNLEGMIVVAVLSVLILLIFGGPVMFKRDPAGGRVIPNAQMFFLGAGFMLLETKGVVHMALLFGSTWIVNSVVFFAILVMILFANLFTMAIKPKKLWPYYVLLIAGLLVNALVPLNTFLSLEVKTRTIVSCAVVFIPVFFAGVVFASSFSRSKRPDVDFGSNVFGIILGGLSEQLSLMLGFNNLVLVAVAYYVFSWLLQRREKVDSAAAPQPS